MADMTKELRSQRKKSQSVAKNAHRDTSLMKIANRVHISICLLSTFIYGCQSKDGLEESFSRYYDYETDDKFSTFHVDRELKIAVYEAHYIDVRAPVQIEFCVPEDEYICFNTDFAQLVFAVPKARLNEGFKWSFDGFDFVVVNSKNSHDCGIDHEIVSKLNKVYHSRFIYNNKLGLRSFSKYIKDSKSVLDLKPDSTFTSINMGFGHRGGC